MFPSSTRACTTVSAVRVRTTRGDDLVGDLVIAGVGITPDAGLAEAAGIATGNGVLVDEFCRTSEPGVYAAGDVANHVHPLFGRRLRVEHDDSAIRHGAAAARSMLGRDTPFDECHWFWSDQYDLNLQYTGDSGGWDQVVIRGSLPDRQFTAFYLGDGVLRAALAINRPKDILRARKLIRARHRPDPARLADEDTDLRRV